MSAIGTKRTWAGGNYMENAYQPELWHDFFVVLGSSSAALIGLLFIATSLHLGEIVNDPILRRRAFNNTLFLLMALVSGAVGSYSAADAYPRCRAGCH